MSLFYCLSVRFACWFSQFWNEPDTKWPARFRSSRLAWMRGLEHSVSEPPHSPSLSAAIHTKQFKMASVEAFECDPDFCPRCGSILPLPGLLEVVSCTLCNFQKDTSGKSIKNFLIQIKAMSWVSLSNMHVQRVGSVDRVQNTRKTRLVPTKPMSC